MATDDTSQRNWFIKGGNAYQVVKETAQRFYFNPGVRWRDSEFVDKAHLTYRDLTEETARAIAAAYSKEAEQNAEARAEVAASRARIAAIRALSRRFICPAPIPAVTPSFA